MEEPIARRKVKDRKKVQTKKRRTEGRGIRKGNHKQKVQKKKRKEKNEYE
jgi:hypothetical protein